MSSRSTASSRQSYSVVVVRDRTLIREVLGYDGSRALIFCVDFNRIIDSAEYLNHSFDLDIREFVTGSVDTILAAQTAAIAAKSLGIDSLFTNSIHRGTVSRIYRQFDIPEKHCFPLIALVLGYSDIKPRLVKGRLNSKGVIHFDRYSRLDKAEVEELVKEHDDPERHLSVETYERVGRSQGFSRYLDWYFTVWAKRDLRNVRVIYDLLKNAGFLQYEVPGKAEGSGGQLSQS